MEGVSILFAEDLPLEECGDFWTAVLSIARATEPGELSGYIEHAKKNYYTPLDFSVQTALLHGAESAKNFYGFPEGSIGRILFRLKRNMWDTVDRHLRREPYLMAHGEGLPAVRHQPAFASAA